MQREPRDERGQANTWDTLGYAYHQLGEHAKAIDCHQHSLDLNRALEQCYNEASTPVHLGQTYRATESVEPARGALREALGIYLDLRVLNPEVERARVLLRELDGPPVPGGPDTPWPRCSVAMTRCR
ncbi:tetratricopeptide repeat protein [Streptomyces sp. NPDC093149]|uniref:tetratricopeptide repeat protein n=1 Tax=Streptomyces sp. NPDC093149 TaxID=3366031 RepID=UPI0037FA32A3